MNKKLKEMTYAGGRKFFYVLCRRIGRYYSLLQISKDKSSEKCHVRTYEILSMGLSNDFYIEQSFENYEFDNLDKMICFLEEVSEENLIVKFLKKENQTIQRFLALLALGLLKLALPI